jgi:hypothetical protein
MYEYETCWNYYSNGWRGKKENDGGSEFKYDILFLVHLCISKYQSLNDDDDNKAISIKEKLWMKVVEKNILNELEL